MKRHETAVLSYRATMEIADRPFRIDVVTIDRGEIRHIRNADWGHQ
jgi:hypothetical protein